MVVKPSKNRDIYIYIYIYGIYIYIWDIYGNHTKKRERKMG